MLLRLPLAPRLPGIPPMQLLHQLSPLRLHPLKERRPGDRLLLLLRSRGICIRPKRRLQPKRQAWR